jgi:osmotically-inducible protein OsmY
MQSCIELESLEATRTTLISSMDDVITVAAEAKLLSSHYAEIRRVSCHFHEGTLTLRGHVSRYYLKQISQNIVSRVAGVVEIDNQVRVLTCRGKVKTGDPCLCLSH